MKQVKTERKLSLIVRNLSETELEQAAGAGGRTLGTGAEVFELVRVRTVGR